MNAIEQRYLAYFDELNVLAGRIDVDTVTVDEAQRRVESLLEEAYLLGYFDCGYELGDSPERVADRSKMSKLLTVKFDGLDTDDRVAECVIDRDKARFQKVLETEWHRLYNGGGNDRAEEVEEEEDARIYKIWRTMRDLRVRDTHSPLEGVRVPLKSLFYTWDGDEAYYPGGFRSASNNVNCRCRVTYIRQ
ncbi:MAG: hypothetical protein ILO42_04800 [Clostridia bacterium]|nr:hypothetical protein [Clostridia bacterium]